MRHLKPIQFAAYVGAGSLLAISRVFAADVTGTPGNDLLFFDNSLPFTQLTTTLINPYSGKSIPIDGEYLVNQQSYDGLDGIDNLFMTNLNDALFLEDSAGNQLLFNIEFFIAGSGSDIIHLASTKFSLNDVTIDGGANDDILWGNVGNDTIRGFAGNDVIDGGPGNDIISGGGDSDTLYGGDGNDIISDDRGIDIISGGEGDDTFDLLIDFSADEFDGGPGFDRVDLTSWFQSEFLVLASSDANFEIDLFGPISSVGAMLTAKIRGVEQLQFKDGNMDTSPFLVPKFVCYGFDIPFDQPLSVNKKAKKAIPVKITLEDSDTYLVMDNDLNAPPVINIQFNGVIYGDGVDGSELLEPVGASNEGNAFIYNPDTERWEYRIGTKQFSEPGTYIVTVRSGDETEYTIDASGGNCANTFTRLN